MLTIDRWRFFYALTRVLLAMELHRNVTGQSTDINSTIETSPERDGDFPRKCYKHLGCFSTGPPFYHPTDRPISLLPQDNLKVNLLLFTPSNSIHSYNLTFSDSSDIQVANSPLKGSLPTKIIVPGFEVKLTPDNPIFEMKDEILKEGSYNVIIDDWTRSNGFPYSQAAANTRKVGAEMAYILTLFKEIKGIDYERVHIIGHSLGAHIGGYVGERIQNLGRITGLDPAGPYFQHADNIVRLDTTDANFVDIIHTNGASNIIEGFGLYQAIGHKDFYPNGGHHQPACKNQPLFKIKKEEQEFEEQTNSSLIHELLESLQNNSIKESTSDILENICEHSISRTYFIESINNCRFLAVQCENYEIFQEKYCTNKNSIVAEMGYHAKKIEGIKGLPRFYLHTSKKSHYCINNDNIIIVN